MNVCCSTWGAHHFGFTRRPSSLLGRTLPRGGGGEVAQGPPVVGARSTPSSATTTTTSASTTRSTAAGYISNTEEVEKLQKGIAELYDESSRVWEEIWGDHMHHGFYDPNYNTNKNDNNDARSLLSDHRSAQIRMIEESLRFAGVSEDPMKRPNNVVDVGCGIGGSSRYIARKYEAQCQGITLSPVQAHRAQALAAAQGLSNKVSFQVADALNQPFSDAQFDLVWSMESGEHMPDKAKDIKAADWSENVAPFWPAVIRSALTWKGFTSLLRSGWKTIRGALVMPLMIQGYKMGLIKFAIITCRKPM
ncbi:gamma-tocopherol methyltransferase, chloroplastic-like isoform X2 [Rhododendron vialii]|uniref:gamma-tocopherol methyltransferase, chloroplastic-like isoform X2 n=1 Tax=Rhododendron vialii TaxID=182163 RepID=UPI00265F1CEF|nr:gamma-tocopherol methyltransferase, chloroplastic-like isoform X2 [Rhododendron vialii]